MGVGSSNFKIGLGDGTGNEGADGANLEIGNWNTRSRLLAGRGVVVRSIGWPSRSTWDDLANQSKGLRNRGLVIGWPGLPGGAQRAFRFSSLLVSKDEFWEGCTLTVSERGWPAGQALASRWPIPCAATIIGYVFLGGWPDWPIVSGTGENFSFAEPREEAPWWKMDL